MEGEKEEVPIIIKKRKSEPNPLSVKKRKVQNVGKQADSSTFPKRKRQRSKVQKGESQVENNNDSN